MTLIEVDTLLALFGDWHVEEGTEEGFVGTIKDLIERIPTIEQPHWIPCSERLPNNDDWNIITILDESGDTPFRYSDFGWYLEKANCWIVDAEQRTDVIAWMPLPEPWKEEKNV